MTLPDLAKTCALQEAASQAKTPADLLKMPNIRAGLLTARGLSDMALEHLLPDNKIEAIKSRVKDFLEPADAKFVEALVFRFLLTRGDTLGGSTRNISGALAQRKLTRVMISTLTNAANLNDEIQIASLSQWLCAL